MLIPADEARAISDENDNVPEELLSVVSNCIKRAAGHGSRNAEFYMPDNIKNRIVDPYGSIIGEKIIRELVEAGYDAHGSFSSNGSCIYISWFK